jgi:DNA-binding NarL/FixJ family response regulator
VFARHRGGDPGGELALAQGHPDIALQIADTLLVTAPGAQSAKQPIPWLLKLKGEALAALRRTEEAIAALSEAERGTLQRQEQALLWRIHRAAGYAHRHLKQEELAQHHFRSARLGIASLASTIEAGSLHDRFLQAALATLPREKPIAAKRTAKQAFGGLTEREREVVVLMAQGKSNREIAEALVVAKVTVETHVNNILHKLGLTSRRQIVLWAAERGLTKH